MQKEVTLIVDPFSSGALIAGELGQYGLSCVAVLSSKALPPFLLASYNAKDFARTFIFTGNIDELMQDIDAVYQVNAIIAGAESGVSLADQLADRYHTFANDMATSTARRDKWAMQQRIAAAGLRAIPSLITNRFDEVIEWAQQQSPLYTDGYIVKPIQSGGSDHVQYCKDLNKVENALATLLDTSDIFGNNNDQVLVQCFMTGEEYVVDAVSIDGQHIITGVLKYNKIKTEDGHLLYNTMDFVSKDTLPEKDVVAYTKEVLTALGVKNGPTHNEIMYMQQGPILIESGARMHGGANPLYCKACSGNSQLAIIPKVYYPHLKAQHYSEVLQYDYQLLQHMRVAFMIVPNATEISEMPQFIEAINALKTYHDSHVNSTAKAFPKTVDLLSSPGFIVLMGTQEAIEADTQAIRGLEQQLYQL